MPQAKERAAALHAVTKRYGAVLAVDNLDLEVRRGEVLAVLGPNGAGKTTSISLLLGLLAPDAGRVELFGSAPTPAARRRIGAMLQVSYVPPTMRLEELVKLFGGYYDRPLAPGEALAAAGLADVSRRFAGQLSGGQKQRLMFALAICGRPDLVFLDEPTVGMDVEARRAFWTAIRGLAAEGRTVVLTTHYLEEADALADRIVVVNRGRVIAEGTPAEIKARSAGRRIRCVTRLSPAEVSALPGVTQVRRSGGFLEVLASRAEPAVLELLKRDPDLTDLEVTGAGLEEAFLALTETAQKEAA